MRERGTYIDYRKARFSPGLLRAGLALAVFLCLAFFRFAAPAPAAGLLSNNTGRQAASLDLRAEAFSLDPVPEQLLKAASGPEATVTLVVWLTPSPGSYIYAPYSLSRFSGGEAGLPTKLAVTPLTPENAALLPVIYPPGQDKKDRYAGAITPVYDKATPFFLQVSQDLQEQGLKAEVSALLCNAASCTPFKKTFEIKETGIRPLAAQEAFWFKELTQATYIENAGRPEPASAPDAEAEKEQLLAARERFDNISPMPFQSGLEVESLLEAVLFGLLAGLILNLMPCVLPVISLKLAIFSNIGGMEKDEKQRAAFRQYNLFFSLGIMVWFVILLIVIGAAGVLWGQFFQSRELVVALSLLLFGLALSMFGIFNLPVLDIRWGDSGGQRRQAFSSGLLATLLATPCSGPLLGGVLGWATQQSLPYLGATVLSVGLGMSLPFLLMALKPGLVRLLPHSGPWAITLERIIGFMLLGTVLYLLNALPLEHMPAMLFSLLLLAAGAWCWGQLGPPSAPPLKRRAARLLAAAMCGLALWGALVPQDAETKWETYSESSFTRMLGNTPMLVEFTADWCPNCKALEYAVLVPRRLERWKENYGLRYIRVDLTRDNPEGQALLQKLNSSSIPVLALFPAGNNAQNPVILRDLVTPPQLKEALKFTFDSNN